MELRSTQMTTYLPIPGGLTVYAHRYLDSSWGFAMGWNYTIGAALTGMLRELRFRSSKTDTE